MRALQLIGFGKPAEFRDVAEPEAGPGEVLIRVGGAGACHSDLHLMDDFSEGMLPWSPPFTLGHENAGWIEEVGPGVTGFEIDAPVAVYGPWGCGRLQTLPAGNGELLRAAGRSSERRAVVSVATVGWRRS